MTIWLPLLAAVLVWGLLMLITRASSNVARPRTHRDALIEFGRAVNRMEESWRGVLSPAVARASLSMREFAESLREAERAARRAGGPPPPW